MDLTDKHKAFEEGLVEYIEGVKPSELEQKRPEIYSKIESALGYRHFCFVIDLFAHFLLYKKMPGIGRISELPNSSDTLKEHYNNSYRKLVSMWKEHFHGIYLDNDDKNSFKMHYSGLPKRIAGRIRSKITLDSLIRLYIEKPDYRQRLNKVFENLAVNDISFYANMMSSPEKNMAHSLNATFEDALKEAEARNVRAERIKEDVKKNIEKYL
jgi:hypothetical protein